MVAVQQAAAQPAVAAAESLEVDALKKLIAMLEADKGGLSVQLTDVKKQLATMEAENAAAIDN